MNPTQKSDKAKMLSQSHLGTLPLDVSQNTPANKPLPLESVKTLDNFIHSPYLASLLRQQRDTFETTSPTRTYRRSDEPIGKGQTNDALASPRESYSPQFFKKYPSAPALELALPQRQQDQIKDGSLTFNFNKRALSNNTVTLSLTKTESLLINQLIVSDHRVCSKSELIECINRDPMYYSGLEMCLSRLQGKFVKAYGERLFKSVRNLGYCLIQDLKLSS